MTRYKCKKCGELKSKTHYYIGSSFARGFSYNCKDCERKRKRVLTKKVRKGRPRVLSESAKKENQRIYFAEYYKRNAEYRRESRRQYYATDIGKLNAKKSEYKRRCLSKMVVNSLTVLDIDALLSLQCGRCAKCSTVFDSKIIYTLDHIIPLSKGGNLSIDNVQLLCKSCNCSKGAKIAKYRKDFG